MEEVGWWWRDCRQRQSRQEGEGGADGFICRSHARSHTEPSGEVRRREQEHERGDERQQQKQQQQQPRAEGERKTKRHRRALARRVPLTPRRRGSEGQERGRTIKGSGVTL